MLIESVDNTIIENKHTSCLVLQYSASLILLIGEAMAVYYLNVLITQASLVTTSRRFILELFTIPPPLLFSPVLEFMTML